MGVADVDHLRAEEVSGGLARVLDGRRSVVAGAVVAAIMVLMAVPVRVEAHQADTSYLKLEVANDAIETRFSFDVVTLLRIVPGLDGDGDGKVTIAEVEAARPEIDAYLRERVFLDLESGEADWGAQRPLRWPLEDGSAIVRAEWHQHLIHFPFRREHARTPGHLSVTYDVFVELGSVHKILSDIGSGEWREAVVFSQFEPDYLFDVEYARRAAGEPAMPGGVADPLGTVTGLGPGFEVGGKAIEPARSGARSGMGRFFRLGVEHIFLGFDHILFLLALIIVSRLRQVILIVTAFTVGHTVTLILATLDVVNPPVRWVEAAIAATIVYVAMENLVRKGGGAHRWVLSLGFGLVHGFGFAAMLRHLELPRDGLVKGLLAFNLGVEAGQIMIVLALAPFLALLARWKYAASGRVAVSVVILACGLGWLADRVFGLGWMPF